jgi:hypothetical protein
MPLLDIGNHIALGSSRENMKQRTTPLLPQRNIQFQQLQAQRGYGQTERVWGLSISRQTFLYLLMLLFSNNIWLTFEVVFFVGSLSLSVNALKTIQHDIDGMRKEREKFRIKLRNLDWETTLATSDLKIATKHRQASLRAAGRIQ